MKDKSIEKGTLFVNGCNLGPAERDSVTGTIEVGPHVTARAAKEFTASDAAIIADAVLPVGAEVWVFARHWYRGVVRKRVAAYRILGKSRGPIAEVGYRDDAGVRGQIRKPIAELVGADAFTEAPDRSGRKLTITEAQQMALDYWRKR